MRDAYFLRCSECGTLVMREETPRICPACECLAVEARHRNEHGCTMFENVTDTVIQ